MGFNIEANEKIIENVINIACERSIIRLKKTTAINKYCLVEEIDKIVIVGIEKIKNKDKRQIKVGKVIKKQKDLAWAGPENKIRIYWTAKVESWQIRIHNLEKYQQQQQKQWERVL